MKTALALLVALANISTSNAGNIHGCAHLSYEGSCGQSGQGQNCFIVNEHKDKAIQVTISKEYQDGNGDHVSQKVYPVPAGGKTMVGCTRGFPFDGVVFNYAILGCEVK